MLSTGLAVSRYISVEVSLATPGITGPAINTALIVGSSAVIDAGERARRYATITEVADDFGTTAVEYLAADAWFAQNPRPDNVLIGRWVKTASEAMIVGGVLPVSEQAIGLWKAITSGSFHITVGGVGHDVSAMSFASASNLNAVATAINTAMTTATVAATCSWNGEQFIFKTTATGVAAEIDYLTTVPALGTDISGMLHGTLATADHLVAGITAETALSAVTAIDELFSSRFYGLIVPEGSDDDQLQIAAYVEACDPPHYLGVTTQDTTTLSAVETDDLASQLYNFGYNKTAIQYSTSSKYAICSYLARILTTAWTGTNTAITLMYKQEPGIAPEQLSTVHADTLQNKKCNVYAGVANSAKIIQYGTSASGEYTDTIIGADALAMEVQTALFNTLYTTNTKVPQTDFGVGILTNSASAVCARYVANGWMAPGNWPAPGVGNIDQGDLLPLGYYVWAPSIALQDPADRAARKSPVLQILALCAGAIHTVAVVIYVSQ